MGIALVGSTVSLEFYGAFSTVNYFLFFIRKMDFNSLSRGKARSSELIGKP